MWVSVLPGQGFRGSRWDTGCVVELNILYYTVPRYMCGVSKVLVASFSFSPSEGLFRGIDYAFSKIPHASMVFGGCWSWLREETTCLPWEVSKVA